MNSTVQEKRERVRETWLLRGKFRKGILVFAAILVIAFMMWVVFVYTKSQADQSVFNAIAPHITFGRTRFMLFITFLGNHLFLIPANLLLIAFFLLRKKQWMASRLAFVSIGGLLIKIFMKNLLHRIRPIDPVIEGGVGGYSFPSGHALLSVVFFGFLIWWAAISIHNKLLQGILIAFFLLLILLISFSRVYLRVHYTTDILAGLCIGFTWLIFSLWLFDKIEVRQVAKQALRDKQIKA